MKKNRRHKIKIDERRLEILFGVIVIFTALSPVILVFSSQLLLPQNLLQKCNAFANEANGGNMTASVDWVVEMCPCVTHSHIIPNVFNSVNFTDTQACTLKN